MDGISTINNGFNKDQYFQFSKPALTLFFLFCSAVTGFSAYRMKNKLEGKVKVINLAMGIAGLVGVVAASIRIFSHCGKRNHGNLNANETFKNDGFLHNIKDNIPEKPSNILQSLKMKYLDSNFPFLFKDDVRLLQDLKKIYQEEIKKHLLNYHSEVNKVITAYANILQEKIKLVKVSKNDVCSPLLFTASTNEYKNNINKHQYVPHKHIEYVITEMKKFKKEIIRSTNSLIADNCKLEENGKFKDELDSLIKTTDNYTKEITGLSDKISLSQLENINRWKPESILFQSFFAKSVLQCLPVKILKSSTYSNEFKSLKNNIELLIEKCQLFKSDSPIWNNFLQSNGEDAYNKIQNCLNELKNLDQIDDYLNASLSNVNHSNYDNEIDLPKYERLENAFSSEEYNSLKGNNLSLFLASWELDTKAYSTTKKSLDELYKLYKQNTEEYKSLIRIIDSQLELINKLQVVNYDSNDFLHSSFTPLNQLQNQNQLLIKSQDEITIAEIE